MARQCAPEPIAALYEQGRVSHVGRFNELEDELVSFTTAGYMGDRSPNRADALVWAAISEIFPRVLSHERNKATSGQPNHGLPAMSVNPHRSARNAKRLPSGGGYGGGGRNDEQGL